MMSIKRITPPAVEPVSVAEVKESFGIDASDTTLDAAITRYIVAAREYAETYMQRSIIEQTLELALDEFPEEIELKNGPVSSIVSIQYIDSDGIEQALASSVYGLDNYGDRNWVIPAINEDWPSTYDAANAVKVRYVAGYGAASSDVPEKIRHAISMTAWHWIRERTQSADGVSLFMVPFAVDQLLYPYRSLTV